MDNREEDIFLDVCGLEPPEPLERVLDALASLPPGARLRMLIDREPHPLYGILRNNRYDYSSRVDEQHRYEILIWPLD
jgi:TusA-related sulfurtransferase